ncbi:MAG: hypothetical protein P4L46_05930 [Fimbriimonas sp.]|nr:hypothetical protein [Fimbriimonas sp.]
MQKLVVTFTLLVCAAASFAQSDLNTRVFTYDGTTATNGLATFEIDQTPADTGSLAVTANTATINNAITSATTTGANFQVQTIVNVRTYIYVNGNFSGNFYVRGPGSGTSTAQNNDIEVRTNRPITFLAQNFTALNDTTVGSVAYTLSLASSYPFGTQFATTTTQTDTAINGQTLACAMSNLPTTGNITLRVARTLTLNQLALGATTYTATGQINLTVN